MTDFNSVYGNERLKSFIAGCTEGKGFPNSMIISGPNGSGKHTFAKIISKILNCSGNNKPCGECSACKKIESGDSPDISVIGLKKDKKFISVDDVREISENAYIAPNENPTRVFIIEDADLMNENAQNALLKLFEEPPKSVYFILLCEVSARLLPTVRSRAPELFTEVFDDKAITEYLIQNDSSAKRLYEDNNEKFLETIRFSRGSIGKAKELLGEKSTSKSFDYANEIISCITSGTQSEFIILLKKAFDTRENAVLVISAVLNALRDISSCKRNRDDVPLMFYISRSKAIESGNRLSLRFTVCAYEIFLDFLKKIQIDNVNLNTAGISLSAEIWNTKKR